MRRIKWESLLLGQYRRRDNGAGDYQTLGGCLLLTSALVFPRICFARRWLIGYIERELGNGVRLHAISRHLATETAKLGAGAAVTADALALVLDRSGNLAHIAG
jgi:hypothetical protein